ncbi:MAG TPA: dTDP-4-dehydrorhamnose 3,5-epimerase [Candidatus Bipolaricaulis anaerobius]|nr:dTDP-4-dehydrorhamnose 3,5-epimerase [Candidatus Bipolaricaulis anaerobius]HNS24035.1 dTDP-4-dehydrorhamnose 3,5-epimerase [Candidatus Bipolaricaulis anaerobius]
MFTFYRQIIPEVVLVKPHVFMDERGYFFEAFKQSAFDELGVRFVQENQSLSHRGVLRGLHFQKPPRAQGKLVRVAFGEILDVAVDVRHGSPTYGQHVRVVLSGDNCCMLYVPPGFAHGFYVQSEQAVVIYLTTEEFDPELDAGILWSDPDLAIPWPNQMPVVSKKDSGLPLLRDTNTGFCYAPNKGKL